MQAPNEPRSFGSLLRRLRTNAGLTQEQLAERAGLSRRGIADLERGARRTPYAHTVEQLAAALGLSDANQLSFVEAARSPPTSTARSALTQTRVPSAFAPSSEPLVGRNQVLADVEQHLAGVGTPLLLLAGEPGIGKTRLLREAVARAMGLGRVVLAGGCHRRGDTEPFTPLLEAMEVYLRTEDANTLPELLRGCDWLAQLMPELADGLLQPLVPSQIAPDQVRHLMFGAVTRFLANAGGQHGLVLVLDDLQWAGRDGLDLLAFVVRSADQIGLRLFAAYRDADASSGALAELLADLSRMGLAIQRDLGPLPSGDAADLLGRALGNASTDEHTREHILHQAGGVPYYLLSFAQDVRTNTHQTRVVESLPWSITQSVRQRLLALPPVARGVLELVAIAGWQVPRSLIVETADFAHEDEIRTALDGAARARLLVASAEGDYRFAHDVVREVVEADIGDARRSGLHAKIGHAIERVGRPNALTIDVLAYHFGRSDDDLEAARYLELAGDRARERQALAAAEDYYTRTFERLDKHDAGVDAARVCLKLGEVRRSAGEYASALEALEWAAHVYLDLEDFENLARAAVVMESVHHNQASFNVGIQRLDAIRRLIEDATRDHPAPAGLAELNYSLAKLYFQHGEALRESNRPLLDGYLAALERSTALARAANNTHLLAAAELNRAQTLILMRRSTEGAAVLEEGLRLAEASGNVSALVATLRMATGLALLSGDMQVVLRYVERALPAAEQLGDLDHLANFRFMRGSALTCLGDWDTARVWLEAAVATGGPLQGVREPYGLMGLGQLELWGGEDTAARQHLEQALRVTLETGDLHARVYVQSVLAEAELLVGRPEQARRMLESLLELPAFMGGTTNALGILAWAHLELGEWEAADRRAAECVMRGRAEGSTVSYTHGLWVQARLDMQRRLWESARTRLEELLALLQVKPEIVVQKRALETLSSVYIQLDEPDRAQECLDKVASICERLGLSRESGRLRERGVASDRNRPATAPLQTPAPMS